MIAFLFSFLCSAWATPATKLTGKFQISGFSFGGRVPGEIYLGENGEFHLQLLRPSGLSILAITMTKDDACFLFDFDSTQYRGTHQEFAALSNGNLEASDFQFIFVPEPSQKSNWKWTWNNKNRKLRRLGIPLNENTNLLEVQYNQWRKEKPNRISMHLPENNWKLKANLQKRETVDWDFNCTPPEGTETLPLKQLKSSLPSPQKTKRPRK